MSSNRSHPKHENITSRWGGMKLRHKMGGRIEEWLSHFSIDEQDLLLNILSKFYYYSEERINSKVQVLYNNFVKDYPNDANVAVFSKIFKEFGTAYSDIVFTSFWLYNNLKDSTEDNLSQLLEYDCVPEVVAFIDDFSGSGDTFITTIDKLLDVSNAFSKTKVFFLVIHITEKALQTIQEFANKTGMVIRILYLEKTKEAFTPDYLFESNNARLFEKQYSAIYERFFGLDDYIFGFEAVASLVAFQYNTPNNTLGLFWKDYAEFAALFPRHKKRTTTLSQMQSMAKQRKKQNETHLIFGLDDGKNAAVLTYCLFKKNGFVISDFKNDFGLTSSQTDEVIKKVLAEGYVEFVDDRFIATPKLKSKMFTSRLRSNKKTSKKESASDSFDLHPEYIPTKF